MNILCKCKQGKVIEILKNFGCIVYAEISTVTDCDENGRPIPHTSREANDKDRLDFIREEWERTAEALDESGIDLKDSGTLPMIERDDIQ